MKLNINLMVKGEICSFIIHELLSNWCRESKAKLRESY